jgi:hypothetical protein
VATEEKSNEITAIPELLDRLEVGDTVRVKSHSPFKAEEPGIKFLATKNQEVV